MKNGVFKLLQNGELNEYIFVDSWLISELVKRIPYFTAYA